MGLKARVFSLLAVLVLSTVCVRCDGFPKSKEETTSDTSTSREQAILAVEKISNSGNIEDIVAYPDMDKEIDGVLYYYIRANYENGMAAAYFVDAKAGQVFVAVRGDIDPDHPLATAAVGQDASAIPGKQALDTSETAKVVLSKDSAVGELPEAIGMTREQIKEKFGTDYKDFSVNYNGLMKANYYMEKGFIVAFGKDDKAKYVYCTDKMDINGAKAGMNFKEIQALLGNTPVSQTWAETPENMVYEIIYNLGTVPLVFFSHQEDGSSSILRIG